MSETSEYPLTLDNIYNDLNSDDMLWTDYYAQLKPQASILLVRNSTASLTLVQEDVATDAANDLTVKDIEDDIYVEEAYRIVLDIIHSKGND